MKFRIVKKFLAYDAPDNTVVHKTRYVVQRKTHFLGIPYWETVDHYYTKDGNHVLLPNYACNTLEQAENLLDYIIKIWYDEVVKVVEVVEETSKPRITDITNESSGATV